MSNSNNEDLANELKHKFEKWQASYFDDVHDHFARGDQSRGEAALSSWEKRFTEFLDSELPSIKQEYLQHHRRLSRSALAMQSVLQNFKRKKGNAIESFLAQMIVEARNGNLNAYYEPIPEETTEVKQNSMFVDQSRIDELRNVQSPDFDLTRLIKLCEELNLSFSMECFHATAMLTRAILDHIPPIFSGKSFSEIANNYPSKSNKASLLNLELSSRNIADSHLHTQIRRKESLPNKTQVNFSNDLDVLLSEIARKLK